MEETNSLDDFGGNEKLPNATASLVLGIISIATCFLYGVPGIICGVIAIILFNKDKKLYTSNPGKYQISSYNNAKAGFICGIIGLSLGSLVLLYFILVFAFVGSILTSPVFQDAMRDASQSGY